MQDERDRLIACIPRLRRYARALLGGRADADDLVQDTIERGWDKLASWRRGSDMRAWLFGIMHNLHVDQLRRPALATEPLDDELPLAAADTSGDALALRDMDLALQQLPPQQREVLLMVALEDMRYEEVAAALDIPLGTVMSRLSRARERLRLILQGQPLPSTLKVVK
ncbi:RNA polymerase sigma factor [Duganella violaceipulchra]|uniref:RNA polymerase sigma factor n=1 Tax=Duganella violaceipulchra TaxID=2849652 RepID=A0AA41H8P7_9BURK|nr:RNA polymerase sigma factor [Duganella violaceicalia]MBV6321605.1 RNA polymerase sigma factor [Duganella violaceicalia]MCP2008135.1 RNA polymerase sigma-70 factor (ECF subfamily) [Duganella violaceicalia]